jgi:Zn finger protein HypA/HybF involved in hydrogenase expression
MAKYTKEILEEAVSNAVSFAGVVRFLGLKPAGGTHYHIANMIRKFEIDHSHFTGQAHLKGKSSSNRMTAEQVFRVLPEGSTRLKSVQLRRVLKEVGVEEKCNRCGQGTIWQGKEITLEINHVDGDWLNCLQDNLEFICPNCHSQESHSNMPHKYRDK